MKISNEGLDLIERQADKKHNPEMMMMMCQILRELRELKQLFQQRDNSCDGGSYEKV